MPLDTEPPVVTHPATEDDTGTSPSTAPLLLLSLLMLGVDVVALIPLGSWMTRYGIVLVSGLYLVHVLFSTALASWTVIRLSILPIDPEQDE
ncbi:hypothetical protein [Nocardia thailandica]